MRRIIGFAASIGVALASIRHIRDRSNIRRLERHLGCTPEEARELYTLARRIGYGAAYEQVFGDEALPREAAAVALDSPEAVPDGPPTDPLASPRPA